MPPELRLRAAKTADIPALRALIPVSVRALSREQYSPEQIESSIRFVFGVDTQLIADGTYFIVESSDGSVIAGCGGWSYRLTLFGGDQMKETADPLLNPSRDAARIRAFFVHPQSARQGVGNRLMEACFAAVRAAGFQRMELAATLPGMPLYARWGFTVIEQFEQTLPDGIVIPFVRMGRNVEASS